MFTLRSLLQGTFIGFFLYGVWPPENMLFVAGGIAGFIIASIIPGLDE